MRSAEGLELIFHSVDKPAPSIFKSWRSPSWFSSFSCLIWPTWSHNEARASSQNTRWRQRCYRSVILNSASRLKTVKLGQQHNVRNWQQNTAPKPLCWQLASIRTRVWHGSIRRKFIHTNFTSARKVCLKRQHLWKMRKTEALGKLARPFWEKSAPRTDWDK